MHSHLTYKDHHGHSMTGRYNDILHEEVATLANNLKKAGLSPQNCMVVIHVNRQFFVSASGIAASDHAVATEDFAQMLRASFDDDHQVIDFLDKIKGSLINYLNSKDAPHHVGNKHPHK